jgi:hypothetical protein
MNFFPLVGLFGVQGRVSQALGFELVAFGLCLCKLRGNAGVFRVGRSIHHCS